MTAKTLNKTTYILLGQAVMKMRPDVAKELLPVCGIDGEKDLTRLPDFYEAFQLLYRLHPDIYERKPYEQAKMVERRLFIGAMLQVYNKNAYYQASNRPIMRSGFVRAISQCLGLHMSSISQVVPQIIFDQQQFPEFKEAINKIVDQLKPNHGNAEKRDN